MLTLDMVYSASHLLKGVARYTDMIESNGLTDDCTLRLKAENLQLTGSFKLRGAFFKIASLPQNDREIVACSAGNHSQGVSLAAGKLSRKAVIFMPSIAPISKVESTKKLGAEVHLVDGVYDDAYLAADAYCKEHNGIFVHPFDDEDVIAGQGSIALEILEQFPEVDTVLVPVGGGGLASGVAFTLKQLKPVCKVYGIQAEGAPGMSKAFSKKQAVTLEKTSSFADGIAVKTPGIGDALGLQQKRMQGSDIPGYFGKFLPDRQFVLFHGHPQRRPGHADRPAALSVLVSAQCPAQTRCRRHSRPGPAARPRH